jgi:hypothetical protein
MRVGAPMCFAGYTSGEGNHGSTRVKSVGKDEGFVGKTETVLRDRFEGMFDQNERRMLKARKISDFWRWFSRNFWCFLEILGNSGNEIFW